MELSSTPSTCFANGTITITLKGNDVGNLSQITYTVVNITTSQEYFGTDPVFGNLTTGNHSVTMNAIFQATPMQRTGNVAVGGNYIAPTAFKVGTYELIGTRKTFNCKNTGRVSIEIKGGVFPYIIETHLNNTLYRSETFSTFQNTGTNMDLPDYKDYYNIENLPAGSFIFKIKDGCDYILPEISETVSRVSTDYLCDDISIAPSDNIADFNIVNINFRTYYYSTDLDMYYYDQMYRNIPWWECTYSFNGEPEKEWKDIPPDWNIKDAVASATKYCDLWNKNYQIKVRVKGCTGNTCNTVRTVEYSGYINITSSNIFDPVTGCIDNGKMILNISFYDYNDFFTAPISYKITHNLSGEVWKEESVNSKSWNWSDTINRSAINDYLNIIVNDINNCVLINNNYQIPHPPDYWDFYSIHRICDYTSENDIIRWWWNECEKSGYKLPEGTKIELFESPDNNYFNFVATYNRNLDSWSFSQDNSGFTVFSESGCIMVLQGRDLISGDYRLRITDACGRNEIVDSYHEFYKYEVEEPLSLEIETTCEGKKYLPKVKFVRIRKNDGYKEEKSVNFEVNGEPGGYYPSWGTCNYDYITLTKPGDYTLNFNMDWYDIECFISKKSLTYTYNGLSLINAYGYACNDGVNKVSKIVVTIDSTSGVAPYRFELYNQSGDYITSNTSGIFFAGEPDETWSVNITDQCGASYTQNVRITNLGSGANVAFAENENICLGDNIYLHGIAIAGAQMGYQWEGPNGFSSQSKDPVIYNATLNQKGHYVLSITGLECNIKDSIFINVMLPDITIFEDTVCMGSNYANHGFDIEHICTPDTTYIFYRTGLAECDTIYLHLTVKECEVFSIGQVGEICANDPFFVLPYNFKEENFFYHIQFNNNAQEQGFLNIDSGVVMRKNYIEVPIPKGNDIQDYVMPHNNYAASIMVSNRRCESQIIDFPFQILYPSWIIEQKWNDVIALLNDRYNGGYTFSKYEWFKNGKKLEGENGSYIYILPTLEFGAEYRARLTRDLDGETFFTCPLIPEYRSGMKVYPQFITQDEPIYIETQQDGIATIWNILGQKIVQHSIFEYQINKIYLNEPGFFLLEVVQKNGFKQTFKIIVN